MAYCTSNRMEDSVYNFEKLNRNADQVPGRQDLVSFFERMEISKYLEIFPKTVNFAYFKTMSEEDFNEYGITNDNDMKILINAVEKAVLEEEQEEVEFVYIL